jgi:hypothetical protein
MRLLLIRMGILAPIALAAMADAASGQCSGSGAISLFFDPSVRSLGMAGASGPVFWGGDPNDWANPALLGYHRGIRFRYSKMQLLPGFTSDLFFSSTRITAGGWGVGFSFAGIPDHLAGARLDYGTLAAVDVNGQVTGIFESWEDVQSFGVGVNVLELAESVLGPWTEVSSIRRWGDLSLGWARKRVDVNLAPPRVLPPGFSGSDGAQTNDLGLTVRLRPIDTIDHDGPGPRLEQLGGLRLDAVYSMSSRNHDDAQIDFGGGPDPIGRDSRFGIALHAETGLPPAWRERFEAANRSWLADAFAPLLALGFAWESAEINLPGPGDDRTECMTRDLYGMELVLANVVSLRWGYLDGRDFGIEGPSWGLGLGFSLGDIAGVRYDHATSPQADGITRRRDQGVMVFFDGIALARKLGPS